MNILFLTMANFRSFEETGIYEDLMREFERNGHRVFVVSPAEKRNNEKTTCVSGEAGILLRVRTGNLQKTNLIRKGLATLRVPARFKRAIEKHLRGVRFDLILYSTPPITLYGAIKTFKKRDKAKTFLLLKDIFPQNAVDLGILQESGPKGVLYRYFRSKEKKLYAISDFIGCMSEANKQYLLSHNPHVAAHRATIVPNSIAPKDLSLPAEDKARLREKYGIPRDKVIFVYGGNLGKPQDIPFIIDCLKTQQDNGNAYFLIAGDGTEFSKLDGYVTSVNPPNVKLLRRLPREDFDTMLAACDVGLIFLDHRFTIPNYPSRILSYMQAGLPVLACVDKCTDVGSDIEAGGFGWQCGSDDAAGFARLVGRICSMVPGKREQMGAAAKDVLINRFTVETAAKHILETIE